MIKKIIKANFWIIFTVFIGLAKIAYALEVDFPEFGGIKPADPFGPAQWIGYIFQFGLAAVGIALVYSFARAGLEWMFSDSITNNKDAIERIKSAVLGFVLLLGSYIILNTINPNLVKLQNQTVDITLKEAGNPNGNGAVGECSGYFECGEGEYCVDKITREEIIITRDETIKSGICVNPSYSSSSNNQGDCGGGRICQTPGFRCLNNATGDVITNPSDATAPGGTCTKKRTWTEACSPTGAFDTGCFKGSCVNNTCVP